ncbi:hypothetical protein ACFFJ7_08700 [Pseudochelatococcus lubricantis]|uniref:hypothetical protein n=1 Tax=Pseudochelatococcus lubricantis TaxID=1538102 RepID=UPI0035F07561
MSAGRNAAPFAFSDAVNRQRDRRVAARVAWRFPGFWSAAHARWKKGSDRLFRLRDLRPRPAQPDARPKLAGAEKTYTRVFQHADKLLLRRAVEHVALPLEAANRAAGNARPFGETILRPIEKPACRTALFRQQAFCACS